MPSSTPEPHHSPFDAVLRAIRDHTHLLLGRTITYSADDWSAASMLPGWTRAHVAAHLITGARQLTRIAEQLRAGETPDLLDPRLSDEDEVLSMSDSLDMQIALDTTSGEVLAALTDLAELTGAFHLREGLHIAVHELPLVRLREVVLHHFDLEPTDGGVELDADIARRLLDFELTCVKPPIGPVRLESDDGVVRTIGGGTAMPRLSGPAGDLFLWATRGALTDRVQES
ncbi:MAG: maleylpyruvate isomerase family mycothiol-dependent enzyme [Propionibacteriaceae bacterium]|nr:maleylpyruvate isomerase family mycothiol-dependent enzyme [Propionibacteriaceae bacterium]